VIRRKTGGTKSVKSRSVKQTITALRCQNRENIGLPRLAANKAPARKWSAGSAWERAMLV
jgi:hypothetical protein